MPSRRARAGLCPPPRGGLGRRDCRRPRGRSQPLVLLLSIVESLQEGLPHPLAVREHLSVARPPWLELDDLHVARRLAVRVVVRLGLAELSQPLLRLPAEQPHHMRKMPKVVSGIGALRAAEIPRARTRRVSRGSMMPSSQSRAVE